MKIKYEVAEKYKCLYDKEFMKDYQEISLHGGRGSGKSVECHHGSILDTYGEGCVLYARKHQNSLRDSVYQDVKDQIEDMGLSEDFDFKLSPLMIINNRTGYAVQFLGGDNFQSKKGLKPYKTRFARIVFEECQEYVNMTFIDELKATVIRGKSENCKVYYLSNPISNKGHFTNSELSQTIKGLRLSIYSTYLDLPRRWLGRKFIQDAERLKETNLKLYQYRYLGLPVSVEDVIFENLKLTTFTEEQISRWLYEDTDIYQGLDFGYHPDPNAGNTMFYDRESRILYIFKEFNMGKLNNLQISDGLDKAGFLREYRITADNDSKSINDLKDLGWDIRAAIKGPGSRDTGMEWLQGLTQIVIDETRCPKTAEEFENYIYKVNKDGEVKGMYPEGQADHHIAAIRYGMEVVWRRKGM